MNPKSLAINSKWTSQQELLGWRHFRIVDRRYQGPEGTLELELMAACDRSVRVWITLTTLKDKEAFVSGWSDDLIEKKEALHAKS